MNNDDYNGVPKVLLPADHPARNTHHSGQYRSQEDWNDSMLPRGAADPDYVGYPGQPEEPDGELPEMLPFMQAIGGDSEPEPKEPVYEESADVA